MRTELRHKKVLLIEDHTAAHETIAELLRLADAEVISAYNGLDGLSRARQVCPDIVVCNFTLPYADGLEILSMIRGDPDLMDIPFVMLSTSPTEELRKKSFQIGANAFLVKDIPPFQFIEAVCETISGAADRELPSEDG